MTEPLLAIYITVGLAVAIFFLRISTNLRNSLIGGEEDVAERILGWMMIGCFTLLAGALWPLIVVGRLAMIGVKK